MESSNFSCCKKDAVRFAELSSLAYKPYAHVLQELPRCGLRPVSRIFNARTDTEGFVAADIDDSFAVVAFRGTESDSTIDLAVNLMVRRARITPDADCEAHGGFVASLSSVYEDVVTSLKPFIGVKEIYVTGHSLGGALASLLTYRLAVAYPESKSRLRNYVYGCPPVGDELFRAAFDQIVSHSITCEDDYVSNGFVKRLLNNFQFLKPNKLQLLPGGEHSLKTYIEILRTLPEDD